MVRCKRCGNKTILATGNINEFIPDKEPFESGKTEGCGFEEINLNDPIYINIQWCPRCCELNGVSIKE